MFKPRAAENVEAAQWGYVYFNFSYVSCLILLLLL